MSSEPQEFRALKISAYDAPLEIVSHPVPKANPGEVVIRILATSIHPSSKSILRSSRPSPFPLFFPITPGAGGIARVESTGPDATALQPGDLVFVDLLIRGRDDPDTSILLGYHGGITPGANRLMKNVWRDGTYAELAKVPLENVHKVDEDLVKKLGYSFASLASVTTSLVAYGGLKDIELKPGERLIIAPATGHFGGAGISVALAMGAVVIATGGNKDVLDKIERTFASTGRVRTVQLTGDVEVDTRALVDASGDPAGADAFLDFSPPAAGKSGHILASLSALRTRGRVSLMGGIPGGIEIPYPLIVFKSLRIYGKFMYERQDVVDIIKLIEARLLKVGEEVGMGDIKTFGLDEAAKGLDVAEAGSAWGNHVVLEP